jgi:hypothetical protein
VAERKVLYLPLRAIAIISLAIISSRLSSFFSAGHSE